MPRKRNIESLEKKCLKRVCLDIRRHAAANYEAQANKEMSKYSIFLSLYNNKLLNTLYENEKESPFPEPISDAAYAQCVDFIFNSDVERISWPLNMDLNEELASVVSRNCKKLWNLSINGKTLPSGFCASSLKFLKNLVVLDLSQCSFEGALVMATISHSLPHLKVLNLKKTTVDDAALYVLCGHRPCRSISASRCSFLKNCRTTNKLKLCCIVLDHTKVTRRGLACVLTHIPTLKNVQVVQYYENTSLKLSNLIRDINIERRNLRMSGFQCQLETLDFIDNLEALKSSLESCPKLKDLCISFANFEQQTTRIAGKVIEASQLQCLKSLTVQTADVGSICTEDFKNFWIKKGPQLRMLCLFNLDLRSHGVADVDAVRSIVACCLNLTHLHLLDLLLTENTRGQSFFDNFPVLRELGILCLELYGDTNLVNTTARQLILSAPNVRSFCLGFTACETLLPYMSKLHLPRLSELVVKGKETAEKFQDLIKSSSLKDVTVKYMQV